MITVTSFNRRVLRGQDSSISHQLDLAVEEDRHLLTFLINKWAQGSWTTLVLDDDSNLTAHQTPVETPFAGDDEFQIFSVSRTTGRIIAYARIRMQESQLQTALARRNNLRSDIFLSYRKADDMAPLHDALPKARTESILDEIEDRLRSDARQKSRGHGHEMDLQVEVTRTMNDLRLRFGIEDARKQGDTND